MVVSIKLRRGKGFLEHSQMISIFTCFEEFIVCLDWVYLSKLLASCVCPVNFLCFNEISVCYNKKKKALVVCINFAHLIV
jgi:hypothetical protein